MVIILVGHLWTIFRQSQGLMDYHDDPRIHGEFSQFGEIDVCDLPGLVFENWLRYVELSRRGWWNTIGCNGFMITLDHRLFSLGHPVGWIQGAGNIPPQKKLSPIRGIFFTILCMYIYIYVYVYIYIWIFWALFVFWRFFCCPEVSPSCDRTVQEGSAIDHATGSPVASCPGRPAARWPGLRPSVAVESYPLRTTRVLGQPLVNIRKAT